MWCYVLSQSKLQRPFHSLTFAGSLITNHCLKGYSSQRCKTQITSVGFVSFQNFNNIRQRTCYDWYFSIQLLLAVSQLLFRFLMQHTQFKKAYETLLKVTEYLQKIFTFTFLCLVVPNILSRYCWYCRKSKKCVETWYTFNVYISICLFFCIPRISLETAGVVILPSPLPPPPPTYNRSPEWNVRR